MYYKCNSYSKYQVQNGFFGLITHDCKCGYEKNLENCFSHQQKAYYGWLKVVKWHYDFSLSRKKH